MWRSTLKDRIQDVRVVINDPPISFTTLRAIYLFLLDTFYKSFLQVGDSQEPNNTSVQFSCDKILWSWIISNYFQRPGPELINV